MAGELKRFSGNPSFTSDTVFETDIIPFTHNPGGSEDGDGKISFSEVRKFTTGEVSKKVEILENYKNTLDAKISDEASASNKLADKAYVDESIQTSTAVNRGNFATYAELIAYSGTVTRNDYATVADDETHNHECWRYKWNDDTHAWTPEYRINESPMTQAQLAALNSGITETTLNNLNNLTNINKESISIMQENIADNRYLIEQINEKAVKANGTISEGDLNNYYTAGMWRTVADVNNIPPGMNSTYGQLLVINGDESNYPTQIYSVEADDTLAGDYIYYRKYNGPTWTPWRKIITNNNFSFNPSTGELSINM